MRDAHDTRRTVDCRAKEVVVAPLVDAEMNAATDMKGDSASRRGVAERLLQLECRGYRIERVIESGMEAVAGRLDDGSPMPLYGCSRNCIMPRKSSPHPFGLLLPQARAALDIGEKKGDDASGCLHRITQKLRANRYQ